MTHKLGLTLTTALVIAVAAMFGSVSKSVAQTAQEISGTATDISAQSNHGNKGKAGQRSGGRRDAGQRNAGQRNVGQRSRDVGQRNVGQRNISQRNFGQRSRDVGQRNIGQRIISQPGRGLRDVPIRDARRVAISGRNYSIWRGSHRVRYGGQWRTFVGLSALSAIMFGSAYYHPYAYINAPAPYCAGLTIDGCQLQWQAVPTLEGPMVYRCVAYCPWQ